MRWLGRDGGTMATTSVGVKTRDQACASAIAVAAATLLFVAPLHAQLTIAVPANQEWVDTGMDVMQGDQVVFLNRGGQWSNGGKAPRYVSARGFDGVRLPNSRLPDAPLAALIGHVRNSIFLVRFDYQIQMPAAGRLYLGMNDVPGTYSDNLGNVSVSIRSYPSRIPNLKKQILKDVLGPPESAPALSTQRLRMPDLRKHSLKDAFGILSKYHRTPRVEQGSSDLPRGLIYDQEPPPGTDLATVREIVLHVSEGLRPPAELPPGASTLRMPDLRKHSLKDAFGILSKYNRKARVEQGFSDLPRGLVYDQDPPPGTDLANVREIVLHVSNGVKPEAPTVPPPPTLRMPDLRRHGLKDAVGTLSKYRRKPRVEHGFSDLPEGLVYDQEPAPGTDLASVREIVLHVSDGVKPEAPTVPPPPTLRMPDLRRHSLNDAVGTLSKYRRKPRVEHGSSDLPEGLVYEQRPAPGNDLASIREIILHVSDGVKLEAPTVPPPTPSLMPDLRKHSLKDAFADLSNYHGEPRVEHSYSDLARGLVYDQEPAPGTDLATIHEIVLHVSDGVKPQAPTMPPPAPLRMPDLRRHSLKDAFAALSNYHGEPRVEHGFSDLARGLVYDQEPPPGTDLATVHAVVLHVSDAA